MSDYKSRLAECGYFFKGVNGAHLPKLPISRKLLLKYVNNIMLSRTLMLTAHLSAGKIVCMESLANLVSADSAKGIWEKVKVELVWEYESDPMVEDGKKFYHVCVHVSWVLDRDDRCITLHEEHLILNQEGALFFQCADRATYERVLAEYQARVETIELMRKSGGRKTIVRAEHGSRDLPMFVERTPDNIHYGVQESKS